MNLNSAGWFTVPNGYNVRLRPSQQDTLQGVLPNSYSSVTATVYVESGTANVHLGLFAMPATVTAQGVLGNDGANVAQIDLAGLRAAVAANPQTMTVNIPASLVPTTYVVRLWVDSITGATAETISRDGSTAAANLPPIPTAVQVVSVIAS